jgi:hypothetical protein
MSDQPAFEVWNPNTGKRYCIFADGHTEGFEDASAVINRIPAVRDNMMLEYAATRIEGLAGNKVYMAAWRRAAKMLRGLKI